MVNLETASVLWWDKVANSARSRPLSWIAFVVIRVASSLRYVRMQSNWMLEHISNEILRWQLRIVWGEKITYCLTNSLCGFQEVTNPTLRYIKLWAIPAERSSRWIAFCECCQVVFVTYIEISFQETTSFQQFFSQTLQVLIVLKHQRVVMLTWNSNLGEICFFFLQKLVTLTIFGQKTWHKQERSIPSPYQPRNISMMCQKTQKPHVVLGLIGS